MPGYLDQYGAGEEERNRIVVRSIVAVVVVAVVGALGWYLLKNHHQEGVVKNFVDALRRGDYPGAYRDWGCTEQKPCAAYPMNNFMSDWGGSGANKDAAPDPGVIGITDSESCNTGVLLTVAVNSTRTEHLWVDKGGNAGDAISFAPYPICPHKSPFAIMIHRTIGKLRKPLLR